MPQSDVLRSSTRRIFGRSRHILRRSRHPRQNLLPVLKHEEVHIWDVLPQGGSQRREGSIHSGPHIGLHLVGIHVGSATRLHSQVIRTRQGFRYKLRSRRHQHQQPLVEFVLHLLEVQVVGVTAEWIFQLVRYTVQRDQDQGNCKGEECCPTWLTGEVAHNHGGDDAMREQKQLRGLRVREWEGYLRESVRAIERPQHVTQVLEDARQDRRGDHNNSVGLTIHCQRLDPLQDQLHFALLANERVEGHRVEALHVDDLLGEVHLGTHAIELRTGHGVEEAQ
mmetsp:Transcript_164589/g.523359  ORF Transcript_164589/g.523359 Transcript_164589/m.523359 type:complete len:280 (-) Transcript_164589:429-1268(-)